ncbi:ABC transporter permease [Spirosoma endbachense]|uniref:FtsX-like permease family protein n=1 Tax=Spirosoma endbachense TaxID=2666025 RepID=A0A6P1VQS6_9BACT|nr:ABC transporter permease [Spirosoma endbachense]QHV94472.1 FtsX-like permease family protein [Spirosoma endbachense]
MNSNPQPPRWANWLLEAFGDPNTVEEVQGDLLELYDYWVEAVGEREARWRYTLSVLKLLRPFAKSTIAFSESGYSGREPQTIFFLSPTMLRNYLKIAWRNLVLHKAFTAINIIGLAIGLATCLLIVLFVLDELSYDRYHAKADRIFRVNIHGQVGGKEINTAPVSVPVGPALVRDYSGVEATTRFDQEGTFIVKHNRDSFKEEHVVFADSNFFDVFSIPLLKGNPKTVLTEPNTIVLTETIAKKYFGEQDPIGQTLTLGTRGLFRVTGVCQDVPSNTHFHYDMFGSMRSIELRNTWLSSGAYTYVVLRPGYSIDDLRAKMPELVKKHIGSEIQALFGISLDEFTRKGDRFGFGFQPITDIHLHSDLEAEIESNSDVKYIYIFSIIAVFILLVACINFMNLSTAGSAGRAKEVGIRKVLGSVQQQLIGQFLSESVLITFMALVVALSIVAIVLPSFNQLAGKQFGYNALTSGWMLAGIVLTCLLIGLLAGSYPAFFLSAFKPVSVLKGQMRAGFRSGWLRNTLVTTQFVVSIGMIIGTLVVYRQLYFIQNKKVGFDKDQVLILHDTYSLGPKGKAFRAELAKLAQVINATQAGYLPAGVSNSGNDGFQPDNGSAQAAIYREKTYYIDENYLPTLGINLAQGRNFSKAFPSDSAAILINEAAAKRFGWKNPIGQRLWTVGNGSPESRRLYTIVGVVKNFHFESMHQHIAPLVMFYGADYYQMALRVRTTDMPGLLKTLEQKWKAQTDNPFAYSFLNERFNRIYQSEQRVGQLFGIFASLTVIISCLGLFGLAMFTAQQRTKEIGVRKVLGASVTSVVALLSKDFLKLVLVAIVIATPLAWYAMSRWLQDFAYKIDIEWWVFVLAAFLAIGIALLTVSFQSIKAALMNPVQSLRSE